MGRVLIVQNRKYVGIRRTRGGEDEDKNLKKMRTTLREMGFTNACIEVHENQSKSEMIRLLEDGKYMYIYILIYG